jgi:hypothetical protein
MRKHLVLLKDFFDFHEIYLSNRGPGSSVGIATGYGLDGPEIESRWGRYFPHPAQTGPGAHPASCTMVIGSFPEYKVAGA